MNDPIDVQKFINSQPLSLFQKLILWLCFAVVVLDGFDTAVVGFLAVPIRSELGIGPAELTPLMMSGLLGLLLGAFLFGPLSDKFGRKPMLVVTTFLFGVFSLACVYSTSIEALTILRFLTGLGLGGAMPNAIALSSEYVPDHRRASLLTLMFCGFAIGMASAGLIATAMIPIWGWRSVLFVGGLVPMLLAPILFLLLTESVRFMALKRGRESEIRQALRRISPNLIGADDRFCAAPVEPGTPVSQLFQSGRMAGTILLWGTFLMSLLIIYLVGNWLPLILTDAGFENTTASLVTTGFHVGGAIGAVILGRLMDRFHENKVLAASYLIAAVAVAGIAFVSGQAMVAIAVFAFGFLVTGGQVGLNALAAGYYPTSARATGVSWANGVGRSGSIIGSLIGGAVIGFGWSTSQIFLLLVIPAAIGGFCMLAMAKFRPKAKQTS